MKLTGKLKENVEKAENKEQEKELIAKAGMILSDDDLDQVAGGAGPDGHKRHNAFHYDYNEDNCFGSNLNAGSGLS